VPHKRSWPGRACGKLWLVEFRKCTMHNARHSRVLNPDLTSVASRSGACLLSAACRTARTRIRTHASSSQPAAAPRFRLRWSKSRTLRKTGVACHGLDQPLQLHCAVHTHCPLCDVHTLSGSSLLPQRYLWLTCQCASCQCLLFCEPKARPSPRSANE
jgi:hypothetical protein